MNASALVWAFVAISSLSFASSTNAVGPQSNMSDRSAPYCLESAYFGRRLASNLDEKERRSILQERWEQIKLAVAHCNVDLHPAFASSIMCWRRDSLVASDWTRAGGEEDLVEPLENFTSASLLIRGNCRAEVNIRRGATIHIYGNLKSTIRLSGDCEVIIAGDVEKDAAIVGTGNDTICVFVGGSMRGLLSHEGWLIGWIHGDVEGTVITGTPRADVRTMGNLSGRVRPGKGPALLFLEVRGFVPFDRIEGIAEAGFTLFHASVGISDRPAGLYPADGEPTGRWVVHSIAEVAEKPDSAGGPQEPEQSP